MIQYDIRYIYICVSYIGYMSVAHFLLDMRTRLCLGAITSEQTTNTQTHLSVSTNI